MKNLLTKIVMFIGFLLTVIGIIVDSVSMRIPISAFSLLDMTFIAAIFAFCFIQAKGKIIVNIGYCIAAVLGTSGLAQIITNTEDYILISNIGCIIMSFAALCHLTTIILELCGFVKKGKEKESCEDIAIILNKYKELEKENIITIEEFDNLKSKALKCTDSGKSSVEDLKKWKKLFDQQIITEEEFSSIKSKIFAE